MCYQILMDDNMENWKNLTFVVFDCLATGIPFEERYDLLNTSELPDHVQLVNAIECTGAEHLQQYLQQVLEHGNSGVMLKKNTSYHDTGKSLTFLELIVSI